MMSSFACLLGELAKTAKEASNFKKRKPEENENQRTGTNLKRQDRRMRIHETTRRPRDFHELNIKISFLCIGGQKCGTTWLHEMLLKNQALSLPTQKEVHFWDWHRRKGLGWYSNQFPHTCQDCLHGEITPCYAILDIEKISEIKYLFPDVRIIFLARAFVDRAWSALLMELRNSVLGIEAGKFAKPEHTDERSREKYLEEADPTQYDDEYFMDRLRHSTHHQRSDYASALRNWLKIFPKEQILILNYDELSNNPRGLLKDVLSFIGSSDDFVDSLDDDDVNKRFNAASDPKLRQPIRPGLRKKMESYLKPMAQDFNKLLLELGYTWKLDEYSINDVK